MEESDRIIRKRKYSKTMTEKTEHISVEVQYIFLVRGSDGHEKRSTHLSVCTEFANCEAAATGDNVPGYNLDHYRRRFSIIKENVE